MRKLLSRAATATALVWALPGAAQDKPAITPPRDWAATLRGDAQAFHDRIAADHPGPYNRLDPGFAQRNDQAFALVMDRAAKVRDVPAIFGRCVDMSRVSTTGTSNLPH